MTLSTPRPARAPFALAVLALALGATLPAWAETGNRSPATRAADETPLDAEAFDAYTRGRTLSFVHMGQPYGIEEYLPDRRVRWAFIGDECQDGTWYERAGNICFLYDNAPDNEQCWRFYLSGDRLRGVFQGPDGPSTELYEVEQSSTPLACQGPGVGV